MYRTSTALVCHDGLSLQKCDQSRVTKLLTRYRRCLECGTGKLILYQLFEQQPEYACQRFFVSLNSYAVQVSRLNFEFRSRQVQARKGPADAWLCYRRYMHREECAHKLGFLCDPDVWGIFQNLCSLPEGEVPQSAEQCGEQAVHFVKAKPRPHCSAFDQGCISSKGVLPIMYAVGHCQNPSWP